VLIEQKKEQVNVSNIMASTSIPLSARPRTVYQHPAAVVWVVFTSDKDLVEYRRLDVFLEIEEPGRLRHNRGFASNLLCRASLTESS
jgi:hypothetical protein